MGVLDHLMDKERDDAHSVLKPLPFYLSLCKSWRKCELIIFAGLWKCPPLLVPCCVQSSWRWKTTAERERVSLVVTMSRFETMASPWPELYLDLFQHSHICFVVLDIFWMTLEASFSASLHAAVVSAVVPSGRLFELLTSSKHTSSGEELIYRLRRVPLCPSRWRYAPSLFVNIDLFQLTCQVADHTINEVR